MWNFFKRRCQSCSDDMESNNNEQEKKKVNEDLVVFMRKRSDHEVPRYTARLKTYVDIQRKRRRAAAARRLSDHNCIHDKKGSTSPLGRKKSGKNDEQKEKAENSEHPASEDGRMSRSVSSENPGMKIADISTNLEPIMHRELSGRRGGGGVDDKTIRARSFSRSRSDEPSEACGRRRRRRKKCGRRRRRRRSCRRRRRRRRSCRRRRRRRRSCSRRRRRRSCRRRRRKRRRCRR